MKLFQLSDNAIPVTTIELLLHNAEDQDVLDFVQHAKVGEVLYGEGFNCISIRRLPDYKLH